MQRQVQVPPTFLDSVERAWDIYWGLKDEGKHFARDLMKHYLLGFGTTYRGGNLPWSQFLSSRPEIQAKLWQNLRAYAIVFGGKAIGTKGIHNTSITGVRLNQLESMRWTLHGCHEIKLNFKYKVISRKNEKVVVFSKIRMSWIDIADLHPGVSTEDANGVLTDDVEFTGAGMPYPIEIAFSPYEYSIWRPDGSQLAGWPGIYGAAKAGIRE